MKEVVEEGLGILMGDRLRVSLKECSRERLRLMLSEIDGEAKTLKKELDEAQEEVLHLYASTDNVNLKYEAGQYRFPLDQNKERLIELRDRIQSLIEKRKPIFNAYEERVLLERQSKILGHEKVVKFKDGLIFALILLVLGLLAVDAGNIGAPGSGAVLEPVVRNGAIESINVVNPGSGYAAATAAPLDKNENPGKGAEIKLEIADGKITSASVVSSGKKYDDSLQLKVRPVLSSKLQWIFWIIDFCCCMIFLTNFIFELCLAQSKKWYWRTHWVDFITSIPLPPAPVLASIGFSGSESVRAGRLLRVVRLLRALRALRLFLFMWRGLDHLAEIFDVRLMKKSFLAALFVLAIGALLITLFGEKGDGHEAVSGFFPGLWWSFTTLVTGGFGDIYNPHTLLGRLLTVFLVVAGMVLVGVFTATLTTVLVGREERAQTAMQSEILDQIQKEGARIDEAIRRMEAKQVEILENREEKNE